MGVGAYIEGQIDLIADRKGAAMLFSHMMKAVLLLLAVVKTKKVTKDEGCSEA